jgi:hypothetical protein
MWKPVFTLSANKAAAPVNAQTVHNAEKRKRKRITRSENTDEKKK